MSSSTALMRGQGAPPPYTFNPVAPRSHLWMMDVRNEEDLRVFGWGLWRTIDLDPDGEHGPAKTKRTAWAQDTRGDLDTPHLAEDLGLSRANATDALRRNIELGRMARDEKGRILVRADTPLPRRKKSEEPGTGTDGLPPVFFCTENCPESFRLIFQSLSISRRSQYVRRYRSMPEPFAKHLESKEPNERAAHTWSYLQAVEYKDQVEADALAAARASCRPIIDRVIAEAGYVNEETRGRNEVKRDLIVELKVCVPVDYFVQKNAPAFCTETDSALYKNKNASVQNGQPYIAFESSLRVSESDSPTQEIDSIVSLVEETFGAFAPEDPVRQQFAESPQEFKLPAGAICQAITDKIAEKRKKRYPIDGPAALLSFLRKDIQRWVAQNVHVVRLHAASRSATPATNTAANARWLEEQYAALNDPSVSEAEKEIIRDCLGIGPPRKPVDGEPRAKAQQAGRG